VYTVPVSELQRSAVRRILAEHEREIGALRFPAP
jgi:hypothetical protein